MHRTSPDTRASRDVPLWTLFPLFFAAVYLSHLTLLRLPYFWDEGGYYIPAAWDFFRTGSLIPQTTLSNAHPPLPSILLAAWWHLSGFVVSGTRTLVCMVTAAALVAVYRLARNLAGNTAAAAATLLTAVYPVWFAQSTLAHADIFAAAFTLWGLSFYFPAPDANPADLNRLWAATMFSLSALSKETAIVTPLTLAAWEALHLLRSQPSLRPTHWKWLAALITPTLPLTLWYAYHYSQTGFVFGNPEFLRYNATANLEAHRILLCLWHRLLHLTVHMDMFVPVLGALLLLFAPAIDAPQAIHKLTIRTLLFLLLGNMVAFSILGGALLTRYLLPMYPIVILLCITTWQKHLKHWYLLAILSAAAFLAGIWINPPYAFAPEDNLTYRDMIVLHQQAIHFIDHKYPKATVLTAWPATSELTRPELGYTRNPLQTVAIQNFSIEQIQQAAAEKPAFDTAFLFSTKWAPRPEQINLGKKNESSDTRYFDFHRDLSPDEVASKLHGEVVWKAQRKGEWAAVLRFPSSRDSSEPSRPLP